MGNELNKHLPRKHCMFQDGSTNTKTGKKALYLSLGWPLPPRLLDRSLLPSLLPPAAEFVLLRLLIAPPSSQPTYLTSPPTYPLALATTSLPSTEHIVYVSGQQVRCRPAALPMTEKSLCHPQKTKVFSCTWE